MSVLDKNVNERGSIKTTAISYPQRNATARVGTGDQDDRPRSGRPRDEARHCSRRESIAQAADTGGTNIYYCCIQKKSDSTKSRRNERTFPKCINTYRQASVTAWVIRASACRKFVRSKTLGIVESRGRSSRNLLSALALSLFSRETCGARWSGGSLSIDRACAGSARESERHELRRRWSCRVGEYDLDGVGGTRMRGGETREWREGGSEGKVGSRRGSAARRGAHGSGEYRVAKTAGGYDRPIGPDLVEGGVGVEVRVGPGYGERLVPSN